MQAARIFLVLGALNAAAAVACGAFGAHALKARLPAQMLEVYHTAVQYHFWHALGLLAIGLAAPRIGDSALTHWAGWLMFAGIALFCGSLYVLSLSGVRWLGAITPFGGAAFIVGWALFALAAFRTLPQ
ncbi:MAG TPA: DUF423 domain-containing protein [Burkholderiales bacterium]|nr:DUF423 domain-containing protein [Burkholderiales bacterium]